MSLSCQNKSTTNKKEVIEKTGYKHLNFDKLPTSVKSDFLSQTRSSNVLAENGY